MTRFLLDRTFIVDVLNDRRESRKTETLLRSLILVPVVQQHGQAFRDTGGVIMAHFCSDAEIRSEDDCAGSGCEVLSAGSGQATPVTQSSGVCPAVWGWSMVT